MEIVQIKQMVNLIKLEKIGINIALSLSLKKLISSNKFIIKVIEAKTTNTLIKE